MTETRFIELLATYGAELSRWPVEERAEAEHLLMFGSHRLRDVWESERVFDRLLSLETDTPASVSLERRILAQAPSRAPQPEKRFSFSFNLMPTPKWAAGGAIAASLALGFAVGYAGEPVDAASVAMAPQILSVTEAGSAPTLLNIEAN